MNVVDGGFVVIVDGKQHNVRVSRQLRPTLRDDVRPARASRCSSRCARSGSASRPTRAACRASSMWTGDDAAAGGAHPLRPVVGPDPRGVQPLRPDRIGVGHARRRRHDDRARRLVGVPRPLVGRARAGRHPRPVHRRGAGAGGVDVRVPLLLDRHARRARAGQPKRGGTEPHDGRDHRPRDRRPRARHEDRHDARRSSTPAGPAASTG